MEPENEEKPGNEEKPDTPSLLSCLIADSAAFIRNVSLDKLSTKIYTIQDVLTEIRDQATRQRLQVLPYEIHMREPSQESIKFVTDFARKTGDFQTLSAVDIRVIALTYQLEKEHCSADHIKLEPQKKTEIVPKKKISDKEMAGFYIMNKRSHAPSQSADTPTDTTADTTGVPTAGQQPLESEEGQEDAMEITEHDTVNPDNDEQSAMTSDIGDEDVTDENDNEKDKDADDATENAEDADIDDAMEDDDDAGWITPNNIKEIKQQMCDDGLDQDLDADTVKCGCLTTDFAMQNVLIQMGLHVVSVEGRLIRQARSYIQKCYGCNKQTSDMMKQFCPQCGNKTLMRVAVTVAPDGTMQYHYPKKRRNFNIRGTKYSLPKPEGGRHGNDIILCEDQKMRYKNMPKQKDMVSALDPEYAARDSPFSKTDTTSKAFNLGNHVRQPRARNPNASSKKSGKKKK